MGEYAGPVMTPVGVREGFSKGERALRGVVGPPGAALGSCGTIVAGDGCCAMTGSFSSNTPPAPTAAPASNARREIGASLMCVLARGQVAARSRRARWSGAGVVAAHTPDVLSSNRA